MAVAAGLPGCLGHLGDLGLGVAPGFLGRVADQGGDPQPELQRRVRPGRATAQALQPVDPLGDAVQRLAPEQLDVGLGRRDSLGRRRGAAEVEPRVPAVGGAEGPRGAASTLRPEVLAPERDVLLGPQPPHDLEELLGPGIALRLVALGVAVGREVVLAADDVDQDASAAEVVERGGGAGEVGRLPVAGPDRDQRLERGGAGREWRWRR